jgi:hypothetical protein
MIVVLLFSVLVMVVSAVNHTDVSNASSSFPFTSPSVVCDAVLLALTLTAAAKNDTCFRRSATCEQCAVDTTCAFCPLVHVSVSGLVLGTQFETTCDVQSLCWQGSPFWFGGNIDGVSYAGYDLTLSIACDSVLPQFGQCALSGIMLLVAASGAALAILCCIALSISFCCCIICRRRHRQKNGYSNLETSGGSNHVQTSYSGNRSGYTTFK